MAQYVGTRQYIYFASWCDVGRGDTAIHILRQLVRSARNSTHFLKRLRLDDRRIFAFPPTIGFPSGSLQEIHIDCKHEKPSALKNIGYLTQHP
jgi:hypothetical protein